jgi:hypothetical protein
MQVYLCGKRYRAKLGNYRNVSTDERQYSCRLWTRREIRMDAHIKIPLAAAVFTLSAWGTWELLEFLHRHH